MTEVWTVAALFEIHATQTRLGDWLRSPPALATLL